MSKILVVQHRHSYLCWNCSVVFRATLKSGALFEPTKNHPGVPPCKQHPKTLYVELFKIDWHNLVHVRHYITKNKKVTFLFAYFDKWTCTCIHGHNLFEFGLYLSYILKYNQNCTIPIQTHTAKMQPKKGNTRLQDWVFKGIV